MRATARSSIRDILGRHPVHPFPARMAPSIALSTVSGLRHGSVVLDPMAGSGTALAIARSKGYRAIGFDVDPLAAMMTRVWTRPVNRKQVARQATRVLKGAKTIAGQLPVREAYPLRADPETKEFIRYWFDDYARRQLAALSRVIRGVKPIATQEVLWCAFSRLIIAKQAGASLAMDLAHSRPHRAFTRAPRKPFRGFLASVQRVLDGCIDLGQRNRGPAAKIDIGDARYLPVADKSVDLVVTSPPYLNAIDYLRCSKFTLVWMGHSVADVRAIRAASIGSEVAADAGSTLTPFLDKLRLRPSLAPRMRRILQRYAEDTDRAIREVVRVLKPKGRVVYVVGENTIRGTYIRTGQLVTALAREAGLRLTKRRYRELPDNRRYLPPPGVGRATLDTRMRREVILTFRRSGRASQPSNR